ncbi:hypothetical protein F4779DRAFT_560130 [Xylariaceae sp. FL0662B]|nr:hypothetical protein F4779DRAFT_560130 [Xylariaceae sp. FL0662B]
MCRRRASTTFSQLIIKRVTEPCIYEDYPDAHRCVPVTFKTCNTIIPALVSMPFAPAPRYVISQHTFTDCDSQPALSVYRGILPRSEVGDDSSSKILPPLFSFQAYVTYGATLASAPEELGRKFLAHALADMQDSDLVRLDIYFCPDTLPTDIVRLYRA